LAVFELIAVKWLYILSSLLKGSYHSNVTFYSSLSERIIMQKNTADNRFSYNESGDEAPLSAAAAAAPGRGAAAWLRVAVVHTPVPPPQPPPPPSAPLPLLRNQQGFQLK
jgi:hypothetical protein